MAMLTKRQKMALARLSDSASCAYTIPAGLNTLEALERRGLVSARRGVGSISMPHTAIIWRITDAGRAALAEQP